MEIPRFLAAMLALPLCVHSFVQAPVRHVPLLSGIRHTGVSQDLFRGRARHQFVSDRQRPSAVLHTLKMAGDKEGGQEQDLHPAADEMYFGTKVSNKGP